MEALPTLHAVPHSPRPTDVVVMAAEAVIVSDPSAECTDGSTTTGGHDGEPDGCKSFQQQFASIQDAIDRVCCTAPTAPVLAVQPKPIAEDGERQQVETLRVKIERLMDTANLDAVTRRECVAHMDPLTLLRFVLARPTLDGAASMFMTTMRWRAERNLGALYAELHPTHWGPGSGAKRELAEAHFYGGLVGTTRAGCPLFVERMGRMDLEGVSKTPAAREAVVDAYTCYLEGIFRVVRAAASAEGRLVRGLLIVDLAGASWGMLRHVALLQAHSKIATENYPELYQPVLLVNAPGWIAVAWSLFTPLIPAETRKKISIVSAAETLKTIKQHVDLDQLPAHLGGTRPESAASKLPPYPRAEKVKP